MCCAACKDTLIVMLTYKLLLQSTLAHAHPPLSYSAFTPLVAASDIISVCIVYVCIGVTMFNVQSVKSC